MNAESRLDCTKTLPLPSRGYDDKVTAEGFSLGPAALVDFLRVYIDAGEVKGVTKKTLLY